jgi:uncharacterized protein YuzE
VNWTFDANAGSLYIYLSEGSPATQREVAGGAIVDLDTTGTVVGIEFPTSTAMADPDELLALGLDEAVVDLVVVTQHLLPDCDPTLMGRRDEAEAQTSAREFTLVLA